MNKPVLILCIILAVLLIGGGLYRILSHSPYHSGEPVRGPFIDLLPDDTDFAVELTDYASTQQHFKHNPFYARLHTTKAFNDIVTYAPLAEWKRFLYDIGLEIDYQFSENDIMSIAGNRAVVRTAPSFVLIAQLPNLPKPLWTMMSNRLIETIIRTHEQYRGCPIIICRFKSISTVLYFTYRDGILIISDALRVHRTIINKCIRAQRIIRRGRYQSVRRAAAEILITVPHSKHYYSAAWPFEASHLRAALYPETAWRIAFTTQKKGIPHIRSSEFVITDTFGIYEKSIAGFKAQGALGMIPLIRILESLENQKKISRSTADTLKRNMQTLRANTGGCIVYPPLISDDEVVPDILSWMDVNENAATEQVYDFFSMFNTAVFPQFQNLQTMPLERNTVFYFADLQPTGQFFSPSFSLVDNTVWWSLTRGRLVAAVNRMTDSFNHPYAKIYSFGKDHPGEWFAGYIRPAQFDCIPELFEHYEPIDLTYSMQDVDDIIRPLNNAVSEISRIYTEVYKKNDAFSGVLLMEFFNE